MKSLVSKGKLIQFNEPKIMGILNLTPDSFYSGSRYLEKNILQIAEQMILEGADILDLGGYSSRPGAEHISENEELKRVLPAIEIIRKEYPEIWISLDTFRLKVAKQGIDFGADIINDISAGEDDPKMLDFIANNNIPFIAMHKKGTPQNMVNYSSYQNISIELISYFEDLEKSFSDKGINQWILDPGFGFAKNSEHNFKLLKEFKLFSILFNQPVMLALSRKSMIYKTLKTTPKDALNGTTVLHTIGLIKNAAILRVHDVQAAREVIQLISNIK